MVVSIIILFLLVVFVIAYVASCIVHIRKIQKELDAISKEQGIQNADIRAIAIHLRELTVAHNELVEAVNGTAMIKSKSKTKKEKTNVNIVKSYYGPIGEA